MVAVERKTTEQTFGASSYNLADLPMRALNHVTTDEDLVVTTVDNKGILQSIAQRKSISREQVLEEAGEILDLMSFVATEDITPVPFKVDQLQTLVELTYYLSESGNFDNEGNVTAFDPENAVDKISQRYGHTKLETLQNFQGCKNFLNEFIECNTSAT